MSIISRRKVRGTRHEVWGSRYEVRGVGVIGSMFLAVALVLAGCDFHGPWDYYPEERDVYTGIYTYGYIMAGKTPHICFSKVYELDETSAEDFAFYDSAYVTVRGRFAYGEDVVDTTMVLRPSGSPNCFENVFDFYGEGVEGETYTMEAAFKWDSAGHTVRSRYKAEAKIPGAVRVKGLNVPQQDGSYEWMEYKEDKEIHVKFLEFPMDMEFIKCALDYDHSVRGVLSVMNYGIDDHGESQKTTINQMFKGMTEADSAGYRGIAMHDPLESSQNLGYTSNSRVADYNALDTLYLMNMMLPLGKISVDFYSTDASYIDYESKVKGSVSDSRIVPESNIENGMGVFSGMAKTTIELYVDGSGVRMGYIAVKQCESTKGDFSDSWDSRGCRLYQDAVCAGDEDLDTWQDGLIGANENAYKLYRNNDSLRNIGYKACYASRVKAAMMLDTTKWSIFLPDTINEKDKNNAYGDGLKRYCVASNFESNHIADCKEMQEQCIESPEKNDCKEYLWMWCADRNWNTWEYPQCNSALVSRYYIEKPKSSILKGEVETICSYYWKEDSKDKDKGKKGKTYQWETPSCKNWCKIGDKGAECQ